MRRMTELAAAMLYALARSVARLPWPLLRLLADGLAWLAVALDGREARVTRRNLELVRPDLDPAAREALVREILRTTARQAFETLRLWTRPAARNLADIVEVHGEALFDAALREPRGLIVAAPHMGNWELLNQWLATKTPLAILYRPPESAIGEGLPAAGARERRRRGGAGARRSDRRAQPAQAPAEGRRGRHPARPAAEGRRRRVRAVLRQAGADHDPGRPARRAQRRAGAVRLVRTRCRGARRRASSLHVEAAPEAIGDADPQRAVAALNAGVEAIARRDFAQYQWTYKRYTLRPAGSGEENPYLDLY